MSNPKPRVRSPLRKGTIVYHGTSSEDEFDWLNGPAWVSDSFVVAKWFAHRFAEMHERPGHPPRFRARVLTFRVKKSPKLAIILDNDEWQQFIVWASDENVTNDPNELAETLCNKSLDGWHVPHNYPEGSDTLLCEPESFLEFIDVQAV